ncbi:MAG TPA: helix-turn-helix transcriptional regulator [Acidimicrobiales bacterium]|nr:helix-turn-helix transcriptional regulator [Acidimicrobiales bacterium]
MARQEKAAKAVYVISVAAQMGGVHPQTLRIYERKGLLDPSRTVGGNRLYSDKDIARLHHIQELTAEGLNLAGVVRVLALESELAAIRAELADVRAAAKADADKIHKHYRRDLVPLKPARPPARWRP